MLSPNQSVRFSLYIVSLTDLKLKKLRNARETKGKNYRTCIYYLNIANYYSITFIRKNGSSCCYKQHIKANDF